MFHNKFSNRKVGDKIVKRKFSIFALTLLLLGQTLLGPLATVSAAEVGQPQVPFTGEQGLNQEQVTEESPGLISSEAGENEATPEVKDKNTEGVPSDSPVDLNESGPTSNKVNSAMTKIASTEAEDEGAPVVIAATGQPIPPPVITSFGLTINGEKVDSSYSKPLEQNQQIKLHYEMKVDLNSINNQGDFFTFQLPPKNTIIDFDNNFNGTGQGQTDDEEPVKFTYTTDANNVVKVVLSESAPLAGESVIFKLNFTAGFDLSGSNSLEQNLKVPDPVNGGDYVDIKVVFIPTTQGVSLEKEAVGQPTYNAATGERTMEWKIKVNEKGDPLKSATLSDATGSRHLLTGKIKVAKADVTLSGVGPYGTAVEYDNFSDIPFVDGERSAYRITYKTKVDLAGSPSGKQDFGNTATFTNNGKSFTDTASHSITYGEALIKKKTSQSNYKTVWEINYNYNLAEIPANKAVITDTLTGPHKLDIASIKVYEVDVDHSGNGNNGTEITNLTSEGISKTDLINGFEITFASNVKKAYKITYEANYDKDFFTDQETVKSGTNKVVTGTDTTGKSVGYSLSQGILTKSFETDFDKKEITWTVEITADNKEINNLTLTDTFDSKGTHTLVGGVGGISITGTPQASSLAPTLIANGFTVSGINIPKGQKLKLVYKTQFDITNVGGVTATGYENVAKIDWSSGLETFTQSVKRTFTPPQATTENGYKTGSYNYDTQKFTWKVLINVNKRDLSGAKFVDTLGPGHKFVPGTLKVQQVKLGANDTVGIPVVPQPAGLVDAYTENFGADAKEFTLTFKNVLDPSIINEVYLLEYETEDSDHINGIGTSELQTGAVYNKYSNEAKFTVQETQYSITSEPVEMKYANELIKKGATPRQSEGIYRWNIDVNKSKSDLGNVTLSDVPSDNLMLIPNTIEVRDINVTSTGSVTRGNWNKVDANDVTLLPNGGFNLNLGNLTNKSVEVRYDTLVLGQAGDPIENHAKITFTKLTEPNQETESKVENQKLSFSSSDASASSTKGSFKFQKIGVDPSTGDVLELLDGVEFDLIRKSGANEYVIRTVTSAAPNGEFTFENVNYGTYYLREKNTPAGYLPLAEKQIRLNADNDIGKVNVTGKVVNDKDIPGICTDFKLTVLDVDGGKRGSGVVVKFLDDNDYVVATGTTNGQGEITISRADLPAGTYNVIEEVNGTDDVTLDSKFKVVYAASECEGSVQPAPTCTVFTITVNDENDNARPNVTVTVKDTNGNPIKTEKTNNNGEITIPSSELPTGKYFVYEGELLIGDVDVSYKNNINCEAKVTVTGPPTCTTFTLEVQDRSGQPQGNVKVTVKDATGNNLVYKGDIEFTTDSNGIVTFEKFIGKGTYRVYDENDKLIGSFIVTNNCSGFVKPSSGGGGWIPPAPTCDDFTITVNQEGKTVGAGVELTLKLGSTEVSGTTDANGKIVISKPNLPEGTYTAYDKDGKVVGTITVTYEEGKCQASIDVLPKVCEDFTLTIVDTPNANVDLKDSTGKTVATGPTNSNGKVVFTKPLPDGNYDVYVNNDKISSITVTKNCEATVTPGVDPENPTDPNKPGTPGGSGGDKPGPKDPNDGNKGDGGAKDPNGGSGNKGSGGSKSPSKGGNVADASGNKLPQTGEGYPIGLYATGLFAIAAGLWMVFRRKSVKQ